MLAAAAASATAQHTPDSWVAPQGLPAGHNGGFKERLVEPAASTKPNIVMLLFDDYGWANAGWHRNYTAPGGGFVPATPEVATPNMNKLVAEGIELNRQYVYKYCSPTRSALQSGRNPYHVNNINPDPTLHNPADPVSGFSAIPRNMTGIATKMAAGGYKTHAFGKWDAGMATTDHSPHGRGYMTSMHYFHHANDYWSGDVGGCHLPGPPPGPQEQCPGNYQHTCLAGSPELGSEWTATPDDCCKACGATPQCKGWAWGLTEKNGNHSCHLKSEITKQNQGNCTSACKYTGCMHSDMTPVVDLWLNDGMHEGPARGFNNSCGKGGKSSTPGGHPDTCANGPLGEHWYDGYEDSIFEQHVLNTVEAHPVADPLFLFWAPHIVHAPLQVPAEFFDKFGMIAPTDRAGSSRQIYHAMVNFADAGVGNLSLLLK
jgi:arylsulfatase A-like enzyme